MGDNSPILHLLTAIALGITTVTPVIDIVDVGSGPMDLNNDGMVWGSSEHPVRWCGG